MAKLELWAMKKADGEFVAVFTPGCEMGPDGYDIVTANNKEQIWNRIYYYDVVENLKLDYDTLTPIRFV